jgi:predicted permease
VSVRRFFHRGRLDAERAREMQAHLDHCVDDLIAAGYARDRARREARRRFGNPAAIREEIYRMNSVPVLETLLRDVRYAMRMLRKTPGFTAIGVATLAIGIGVNTAVFTVVNSLLLKPLPYPEPWRLATISTTARTPRGTFTNAAALDGATFFAIRDNVKSVDAAVQGGGGWGVGVNLVAQNHAANVKQARVSAGYFKVLGVLPAMGREFNADEDRQGGPAVAVLSHALWTRVFDARADIVGSAISLRGEPYTVIGVMPAGFNSGDVWTPLRPNARGEGGGINYEVYLRLKPGASWEQASAEMRQYASPAMAHQYSKDAVVECGLAPLQDAETAGIRQPLLILWGAVGLVLLIACVNVAGLLIARSGARTREIATRLALGSGRWVVIRQLLVESAVLAAAGGTAGVALGWGVLNALQRLGSDVFDFGYPVTLDARVLGVSLLVALATSVFFGLVPALQATRVDVQGSLAEGGTRSIAGGRAQWPRRILVAGEVALGVVLLVGSGLLVRTFLNLSSLNPGFDPTNVTTAMVSLQDARYQDAARVNALFSETLDRIRRQPGVEAAGITLGLPYTRLLNYGWTRVEGATADDKGGMTNASYVTPGYLEALRVPLREGRLIAAADQGSSTPVVVVNEEFVRKFYKAQHVVGLHIRFAGTEREIVGVVGSARATSSGLGGDGSPLVVPYAIYVPAAQMNSGFFRTAHTWFSPSWVVRSSGAVSEAAETIRQAVAAFDPMLPVAKIETMTAVRSASLARQRFMMSLVAGLGVVALVLAAIGIHGLIASSVAERTRELGIRVALGATSRQVLATVIVPGLTSAAVGVAAGTVAAIPAAQLLRAFIWGVQPGDPVTFLSVVGGLLLVALAASLIPALRVLRLDPASTLRAE